MNREILVIISTKHPSTAAKVSGIYRYAKSSKWKVHVADTPEDAEDFPALLELWNPDGCIFEAGAATKLPDVSAFAGVKTVFLDADRRYLPKKTPVVIHDSEATGRLAAKELLSIGRTSFAFVGAPGDVFWSRDREAAFLKTLRLNGRSICRSLHPRADKRDDLGVSREIAAFVSKQPIGCGIFAANDALADKVLSVCARLRRSVPDDIAVIGVDNDETVCTNAEPTLSSVAPDFARGGYLAAEMLDGLMHGRRTASRNSAMFGPITLVRRASTAAPSAYGGLALKILEHIRNHEGRVSPSKIFTSLGCARRTAELHFRKATGKSILEAISEVRLEFAQLLLRQRHLSITDIASRVGYNSVITFDRFFKSRTGKTPSKWQENPNITSPSE